MKKITRETVKVSLPDRTTLGDLRGPKITRMDDNLSELHLQEITFLQARLLIVVEGLETIINRSSSGPKQTDTTVTKMTIFPTKRLRNVDWSGKGETWKTITLRYISWLLLTF
jgi:hypothetical protein